MSETLEHGSYLAARQEWTERYGDLVQGKRNWQRIALLSCVTSVVLACLNVYQATTDSSRIIPVVVDGAGRPLAAGVAQEVDDERMDRLKRATLERFVGELRTVTTDGLAQRAMLDKVFAYVNENSAAQTVLREWYTEHDPFKRGRDQTVSVQVHSVLPMSNHTFQVDWTEIARDPSGAVEEKHTWRANIVLAEDPPEDEVVARQNPLGLYVTDMSWSEVRQ